MLTISPYQADRLERFDIGKEVGRIIETGWQA